MPILVVIFDRETPSVEFVQKAMRAHKGEAHQFAEAAMLVRTEPATTPSVLTKALQTCAKLERKEFTFTVFSYPFGGWKGTDDDPTLVEWLEKADADDDRLLARST